MGIVGGEGGDWRGGGENVKGIEYVGEIGGGFEDVMGVEDGGFGGRDVEDEGRERGLGGELEGNE